MPKRSMVIGRPHRSLGRLPVMELSLKSKVMVTVLALTLSKVEGRAPEMPGLLPRKM